tara:strand:+ start:9675 stop:9872 length:198 start_codon:yes stop_codon:yes gene_type:complete
MADKAKTQKTGVKAKYKAANPSQYKEWFNSDSPNYTELSKGESVAIDPKNKFFKNLIEQSTIIKE